MGLATGLLVALLGWTLVKGVSEFRADAGAGVAQIASRLGASSAQPLPREWNVVREPYTFEHMFRAGDEPETLDDMYRN